MLIKTVCLFSRLAFRNIFRNKKRTFSALFTVSIGACALMVFLGFNTGIMNQYRDNTIRAKYGNGQLNTANYLNSVYERPWEHWIENPEVVMASMRSLPMVTNVFPRITFYALLSNGQMNVAGVGEAVDGVQEGPFFTMLTFDSGKLFSSESDGIVVGKGLARALNVKVGDRVTVLLNNINGSLNGADLNVTGIFWTGLKDFDDRYFRIQIKEAQKLLETNRVESIAVGLREVSDWNAYAIEMKTRHPELDATGFEVLDEVFYKHAVDFLAQQFAFIKIIILFIVFLGIFNTVSTAVMERAGEIGTLRANGEYGYEVASVIMLEHFFLGLIGVILGIGLAVLLSLTLLRNGIAMPPSPGITKSFSIFLEMEWWHIPPIIIGGVLTTVLGCVLPIIKLVRMPITDLLKHSGY